MATDVLPFYKYKQQAEVYTCKAAFAPEKGGDPRSGEDRRQVYTSVCYL